MDSVHNNKPSSGPTANAAANARSSPPRGLSAQDARSRQRAMLRFALGQAQVFGAALAFVLLLQQGTTTLVICVTAFTRLLTVISLILFRVIWRDRSRVG